MKTKLFRCITPLYRRPLLLSLFVAVFCFSAFGHAKDGFKRERVGLYVEDLTERLVALNARYHQAGESLKAEIEEGLVELATERQVQLADLIQSHPGMVMKNVLPDHVRDRLPKRVKALVESKVERKGKLEVWCVNPNAPLQYFLNTDETRFAIHFDGNPPNGMSDDTVRVKGVLLSKQARSIAGETDGAMAVEPGEENVMFLSTGNEVNTSVANDSSSSSVLPDTFGEQRTAVILIQYENDDEVPPWTVQEVRDLVFGEVSDFFLENSYGQTWLSGDIYGWLRVPVANTVNCEMYDAAAEAEKMLEAEGIDIYTYRRIVYVFPSASCKGFAAVGTVGGNPSRIHINGSLNVKTVAHEMGHNFGLRHSHALDCGNTTLASDCSSREYGDTMCTMASPDDAFHFNAVQKEFLGWLNYGESPSITPVTNDGLYTIDAYETQNGNPKALKIPKSIDPNTGRTTWYFVEFRQPIGFDTPIAEWSDFPYRGDVTNGVEIHLGETDNYNSSYLLHMHPISTYWEVFGKKDWRDPALLVGDFYSDEDAGVTVETISADGNQATIKVSFQAPVCNAANPGVMLTPVDTDTGTPGSTITYQISLTNHDSADCSPSEFEIQMSVPGGWIGVLADSTTNLSPGESMSTTLDVTSSLTAAEGAYSISVSAENVSDPTYQGTASGTCTITTTSENYPPIAEDDAATAPADIPIIVDVLANDFDPDGDVLEITGVTQGAKGVVTINADSTVTYTPGPSAKRSDNFSYTISDGLIEASASVTVKFQKSSGGGDKDGGSRRK